MPRLRVGLVNPRTCKPSEQVALFDLAPSHCDPERIDPLQLQMQSMAFYRMPADYPGEACLYFVIDSAPISLSNSLGFVLSCQHTFYKN
ncbi:MAG: hypothetical protein KME29_13185 [Calothrix sp. FI2-JRJ7]|jgi:hypothetical protein|nr:hypothetical protein [Calothrix sp. FI2-JRJ7]